MGITFTKELVPNKIMTEQTMTEKTIIITFIDPPPYKDSIISKLLKCESLYADKLVKCESLSADKLEREGKYGMDYILNSIEKFSPNVSMEKNKGESPMFSSSWHWNERDSSRTLFNFVYNKEIKAWIVEDLFHYLHDKEVKNWIVKEFKKNGIDFTCSSKIAGTEKSREYSWSWVLHLTLTPKIS